MKRAIAVWAALPAWVAVASLCACEHDVGPSAVAVGDEVGRVTLSTADPVLALTRGATTLLAFPREAFQLGVIDHVDPMIAYDPYFVAQGMTNPSSGVPVTVSVDRAALDASAQGWFWSSEHGGALYLRLPPGGGATTQ